MTVSIKKTHGNYLKAIESCLSLINYKPKKDKIFLKPNVVNAFNAKHGLVTPLEVVEAVIKYFKPISKEIVIGEGSVVGSDSMEVMKKMGYDKLAKKYNCHLVDLNKEERIEIPWKFGQIKIPKIIKTHEYVNIPVIKTHSQTIVTISTKNQKGLLKTADKKLFHILGLHEPILELGKVVKPDLNIVSGIYCLQGNSVSFFKSVKHLDIIVCGQDLFEVDNSCIEIMGIEKKLVKHIPQLDNIEIKGERILDVKTKFKVAKQSRRLFNLEFRTKGCSGCTVNIQKMLKLLLKRPILLTKIMAYSIFKNLIFVTGNKKQVSVPKNTKNVIFLGKCTSIMAKERRDYYLDGCPPSPESMILGIEDFFKKRKELKKEEKTNKAKE